jgi:DNA-directed RNA polymerase subunit RPC12/RpoP
MKRLYRCLDCQKGTLFTPREENRAARLRCSACGSARLEVSAAGGKHQTDALDARREAQERMDENGSGSILPA